MSAEKQDLPAQGSPQQIVQENQIDIEQQKQVNNVENENNDKNAGQIQNQLQQQKPPISSPLKQNKQISVSPQNEEEGQAESQKLGEKIVEQIKDPQIISSSEKQSYINRLQIHLNKMRLEMVQKNKALNQVSEQNKKTKQSLKKVRFQLLSSKQQISSLNQQNVHLQKLLINFKQTNEKLTEQINVFREAGDINFYKNKITELQNYIKIQKEQLKISKQMIDEQEQLKQLVSSSSSKVQILSLLQKYENQNRQLNKNNNQITALNKILQNQIRRFDSEITELKIKYIQDKNQVIFSKQTITNLKNQLKQYQNQINKKTKQLQESSLRISNNQSGQRTVQSNLKIPLQKSPQQKYGIKVLTPSEQRDLILKQFIQLDVKYQNSSAELISLRDRHYNTLKQIKNLSTTHIPKKDYSELFKRYTKLRKCLQNSLQSEQNLKNQLRKYTNEEYLFSIRNQNQNFNALSNEQKIKNKHGLSSLLLQEPQKAIQKVQKIIQKSTQEYKHYFSMKQQLQTKQKLIKTEKLLKQKDDKVNTFSGQLNKIKTTLQLYDKQLLFKNNQIELLRRTNKQNMDKIFYFQKNYIPKDMQNSFIADIQQKRTLIQILQIKNIQALKENNILKNQKNLLTQLYTNMKTMYEQVLNKQPQPHNQVQRINPQSLQNVSLEESKVCRVCKERQQKLKQTKFLNSQIQTEGLGQLYYKQIKQLLTILRKFPKKVDSITTVLQHEKSTISDVKKRYDQVVQVYGAKYRQLQQQKRGNDQWRIKQKEQIRQEFQQIRDLLLNQRLLGALRRAKSLIEYFQQNNPDQQQGADQGQQGQVNQKNQPVREEEPIQQEKQNP